MDIIGMFIEWDDKTYSVGIKKIDNQHQKLVGLINALDQNRDNSDHQFVEKILNTLIEYTKTHFKEEERLLKKFNYQDFDIHCSQHQKFIQKIDSVYKEYRLHQHSQQVLGELLEFLRSWLTTHILVQDKEYAHQLLD